MVQKRPGEELDDCSIKQPRCSEHGYQAVSNFDTVDQNASHVHHYLGHEGFPSKTRHQCNGRLGSDTKDAELLSFTSKEMGRSLPSSFGNSSWVTTSEENLGSDSAFRILLSPDYYNDEDHVGIIVRPKVLYYSLLDIPQQKIIPIGTDYQAEIPESGVDGSLNEYKKFGGICVVPMHELEVSGKGENEKRPGSGRTECLCADIGSIRCVKQHVEESRVTLRMIIGTETFCKLGLDDMGEVVAEKWREEEREIFHEVIYSNPESLGMNFWDQLAKVFPLRTKKEIVSYYFNVFILRKRADQNRCNVADIDSDNDELESSDEVMEKISKDDDSVSESVGAEENPYEHFVNQERTCDDVLNQSILNPSSHFLLHEENGIYYRDEMNGLGVVETGNGTNTCIDLEEQGPGCQNGVSPALTSEKANCSEIYYRYEMNGLGVETGNGTNTCVGLEEQSLDSRNVVFKAVTSEKASSEIYYRYEMNGIGLEEQGPDRRNGVSTGVASQKANANCNANWTSKDGDEHDPQGFLENEGFLLSTSSVLEEIFGD